MDFAHTLEATCIKTVEAGKMTKDLAVCIHGNKVAPDQYLTSEAFMAALREGLERGMK